MIAAHAPLLFDRDNMTAMQRRHRERGAQDDNLVVVGVGERTRYLASQIQHPTTLTFQ